MIFRFFVLIILLGNLTSCTNYCDETKNAESYNKAVQLMDDHEYKAASVMLRELLRCNPSDSVYFHLGSAYLLQFSKDKRDSAIYYLRMAIVKNPRNTKALYNLGALYTLNDSTCAKGLNVLLNLYQIDSGMIGLNNTIANAYHCLNMPDKALIYELKEVKQDSSSKESIRSLGTTYLQLGDYDNAIKSYNKVLSIDSNDVEALHKRGIAKVHSSDTLSACTDFQKAVNLNYKKARESIELYCNSKRKE